MPGSKPPDSCHQLRVVATSPPLITGEYGDSSSYHHQSLLPNHCFSWGSGKPKASLQPPSASLKSHYYCETQVFSHLHHIWLQHCRWKHHALAHSCSDTKPMKPSGGIEIHPAFADKAPVWDFIPCVNVQCTDHGNHKSPRLLLVSPNCAMMHSP